MSTYQSNKYGEEETINEQSFLTEYENTYKNYFVKRTSKKINLLSLFNKLSRKYLKKDLTIHLDDYCFIAKCVYYDIIYITPTVKPKALIDPVRYNNNDYYCWSISRQIVKGSLINNKRAIIIFKTNKGRCVISLKQHNSDLNTKDTAEKTYNEYMKIHSTLTIITQGHPNCLSFLQKENMKKNNVLRE